MPASKSHVIGGNSKLVRSINRAAILNLIRTRQPISRVDIARTTGLNKSTVSSIANDLITENLISEQELQDQNPGRNPIQLSLKTGTHFVGAVNIDSSVSRVALVDINGNLIQKESFPSQPDNQPARLLKTAADHLKQLKKKANIPHLEGIGVSVAGIVDRKQEIVHVAPNLDWQEVEIGSLMRQYFSDQENMSFENDAKASALAELWFGQGRITGINDFVFLSVGIGIGSGIVVNKKLLDGFNHSAGEFGHTVLFEDGPLCSCGNRGCLESYASDRAIVEQYKNKSNADGPKMKDFFLKDLLKLTQDGEAEAQEIIRQAGVYLGLGISTIVKAVDPQAVVIGGKITQAWDLVYPEIIRTIAEHDLFHLKRTVEILPSSLKIRPRLIGAATLAIREIFSDYQIVR